MFSISWRRWQRKPCGPFICSSALCKSFFKGSQSWYKMPRGKKGERECPGNQNLTVPPSSSHWRILKGRHADLGSSCSFPAPGQLQRSDSLGEKPVRVSRYPGRQHRQQIPVVGPGSFRALFTAGTGGSFAAMGAWGVPHRCSLPFSTIYLPKSTLLISNRSKWSKALA